MIAISSAALFACSAALAATTTDPAPAPGPSAIERAVVSIRVTGQDHSFRTPWTKLSPWSRLVNGLVVEGRRILVTGSAFGNHTLVEVQKLGQPERFPATVKLIDYEVPLALLVVEDAEFWEGLQPLPLADKLPREGDVTVHRWLDSGQFESAKAVVRQIKSADHGMGRAEVLSVELASSIPVGGASEVVVSDGKVLGLTTSKTADVLTAMASPVLAQFMDMVDKQPYLGFARHGFTWQRMLNPALRESSGLGPKEGGVLVNRVMPHGSAAGVLEPRDVILEIGGARIDSSGQVEHARYGRLLFHVLFTDGRRPGEELDVRIIRAGQRLSVKMPLKRWAVDQDRIQAYVLDRPPDYVQAGGLVFQHLTLPYLATFQDWRRKGPLRLLVSVDMDGLWPTPEHPRVVVLTQVLPDAANLGYQDLNNLVVTRINGVPTRTLEDVRAAFAKPVGEFHVVEFMEGQGITRLVLDAVQVKQAESRVRTLYGLDGTPAPQGG